MDSYVIFYLLATQAYIFLQNMFKAIIYLK